jgi:hypothetical protein
MIRLREQIERRGLPQALASFGQPLRVLGGGRGLKRGGSEGLDRDESVVSDHFNVSALQPHPLPQKLTLSMWYVCGNRSNGVIRLRW